MINTMDDSPSLLLFSHDKYICYRYIISVSQDVGPSKMHPLRDYIDRVIPTNGFICNDFESDAQFWTGYRIFVRDNLDSYDSVEDWKEQTGGWSDRDTYSTHANTTEYVLQSFHRGCDVILDAGYKSVDLGFSPRSDEEDCIINFLERNHMLLVNPECNTILAVVNLHRRRCNLSELSLLPLPEDHPYRSYFREKYSSDLGNENDDPSFYEFLDETSRTAKIEALRKKINELEHNIKQDVATFSLL